MALFSSCRYDNGEDHHWLPAGSGDVDSVEFRTKHHYHRGFNFRLIDTLSIATRPPFAPRLTFTTDSLTTLRKQDIVMVEEVKSDTGVTSKTSEYWIRLTALSAADGNTTEIKTGWVNERSLLSAGVPDHPISRFIRGFSDRRLKVTLFCIAVAAMLIIFQALRHRRLRLVHFNDIGSFYPTLLTLLVSGTAVLYQTMQEFVPDTWIEFYYHPTLNPFNPQLPPVVALFVAAVWLLVIGFMAVTDELRRRIDITDGLTYLSGLCVVCIFLYLIFTIAIPVRLAYPLLALYWTFAIVRYKRHHDSPRYLCGKCGHPLQKLGKCPSCGAENS